MKLILIFLNIAVGFNLKYKYRYNFRLRSSQCLTIQPLKTIALFKLNEEQVEQISTMIDNRFKLEPIYLDLNVSHYLGITVYKYNTTMNKDFTYTCKLFVNVINIDTKLCGQYILESIDYKKGLFIDQHSIICSFYGSNPNYYCYLSYLQDPLDISYYNNYNYYNYIIDNDISYINLDNDTQFNNIARFPEYTYISQLKYKNMYWSKADIILYYKNSYDYIINAK